jgi:hypothetical protein
VGATAPALLDPLALVVDQVGVGEDDDKPGRCID